MMAEMRVKMVLCSCRVMLVSTLGEDGWNMTYTESKVEGETERAKVGGSERHPVRRQKVPDIRHRAHDHRERGKEEDGAKSPPRRAC
jgi:hypothetical protein